MDENEKDIKAHLTRLIDSFARQLPDAARVTADLWKFAKMHDRRSYQLIKFCIAPESDYRTVFKAIVCLSQTLYIDIKSSNQLHVIERVFEADRVSTRSPGYSLRDAHSSDISIERLDI